MIGQGSPTRRRRRSRALYPCLLRVMLVLYVACSATTADAAEVTMRLRIAWGGGSRTKWIGKLSLDHGRFENLQSLGLGVDTPGSHWIASSAVHIQQRSARTYDALDVTIRADLDAKLLCEIHPDTPESRPRQISLTLGDLLRKASNTPIDDSGNRFYVRRSPGDRLRMQTDRQHLVFQPGERFQFHLEPDLRDLQPDAALEVQVDVTPARASRVITSRAYSISVPSDGADPKIPVEITLPEKEGAYDVHLRVQLPRLSQRFLPVVPPKILLERKFQLVAIADSRANHQAAVASPDEVPWKTTLELDPANPAWWKRMVAVPTWPRLPGWPQGPLRQGNVRTHSDAVGRLVELAASPTEGSDAWEAYPLSVQQVGSPHRLEVEYPAHLEHDLGVSILETNAAGTIVPIGIDSGVSVRQSLHPEAPQLKRLQIIFWPKTKSPTVLLTRRQPNLPALYGKIRLQTGPAQLPPLTSKPPADSSRLIAAHLTRPLLPESFSATGILDPANGQVVDDWKTFYEATIRMGDYLRHAGYNGLALSVCAEGSAVYPSQILQPTPRHDTGQLSDLSLDPIRKNVVEMICRVMDRENLQLVPAIEFTMPIPQLEAMLRVGGPQAEGIALIGPDGKTWSDHYPHFKGQIPYYNPLHPKVQQTMREVVREIVATTGNHRCFRGLAIQLTGKGYAQLPGPEWGMDDTTIAQFERDTNSTVPGGNSPNRFAVRSQFLLGNQRAEWLRWRCLKLAEFYQSLEEEVRKASPSGKLYLCGAQLVDNITAQRELLPALPQATDIHAFFIGMGIDAALYANRSHTLFLRPRRSMPGGSLLQQSLDIQLNSSAELDSAASQTAASGVAIYQPLQRQRLASFDRLSPIGEKNTFTMLLANSLQANAAGRKPLVESLDKQDLSVLFDSSAVLPTSCDASRSRLLSLLGQLPHDKFSLSPASRQPITVRVLQTTEATYVCLINGCPFTGDVSVRLKTAENTSAASLPEGTPIRLTRQGTMQQWNATLKAYDFVAAKFNSGAVEVSGIDVSFESELVTALDTTIRDLESRATGLANEAALLAPENADFENGTPGSMAADWTLKTNGSVTATLTGEEKQSGNHALRLRSAGDTASLQSAPFPMPQTGRLALSVWLKTADTKEQPVLRLAIEGPADGQQYYRYASLGGTGPGKVRLNERWTPYIFQVNDLPVHALNSLRVRFDIVGKGEVLVDNVRLLHLKFSKNERIQLAKILVTARSLANNKQYTDALRLLDGYWPQFLQQHVEPVEIPIAREARTAKPTPQTRKEEKQGTFDKLKDYVPRFMRF